MSELPHVDSFDPEDGGGLAPHSKSENSGATDAAHEEARPVESVELDISDPNFMADAYDTYADLRAKGPVSRVRFAGGEEEESDDGDDVRHREDPIALLIGPLLLLHHLTLRCRSSHRRSRR